MGNATWVISLVAIPCGSHPTNPIPQTLGSSLHPRCYEPNHEPIRRPIARVWHSYACRAEVKQDIPDTSECLSSVGGIPHCAHINGALDTIEPWYERQLLFVALRSLCHGTLQWHRRPGLLTQDAKGSKGPTFEKSITFGAWSAPLSPMHSANIPDPCGGLLVGLRCQPHIRPFRPAKAADPSKRASYVMVDTSQVLTYRPCQESGYATQSGRGSRTSKMGPPPSLWRFLRPDHSVQSVAEFESVGRPRTFRYWSTPSYGLTHGLQAATLMKRMREMEKMARRLFADSVPSSRKRRPLLTRKKCRRLKPALRW